MENKYDALTQKFSSNSDASFIREIRFPEFRNLEPGMKIEFTHPVTALVGPNGTNKSSILRAIQACPRGFDLGTYWFETELDHIASATRYIHRYLLPSGNSAEVIKVRTAHKGRRHDYFETDNPRTSDRMEPMSAMVDTPTSDQAYRGKTRWQPAPIPSVTYLDFRQELPAHNIALYFEQPETAKERRDRSNTQLSLADTKKARIRKRSKYVRKALDGLSSKHFHYGRNRILQPAYEMSALELESVAAVTGRVYSRIRIVGHDYFGFVGSTVQLHTTDMKYSEAAAGSGEFASIMLIRELYKAPKNSLILLDEPETSLHPAAQVALTNLLIDHSLRYGHQVVLATHSPSIIDQLKSPSIKVLDTDRSTGKVRVIRDRALPSEAFNRIGASFKRPTILVEDRLAAEFLKRAARIRGSGFLNSFIVEHPPGGESVLRKSFMTTIPLTGGKAAVVLDGDQRPSGKLDPQATNESVFGFFGIKIRDVPRDSSPNPGASAAADRVADWCREHVCFLPGDGNPEQLLVKITSGQSLSPADAKRHWADVTKDNLRLLNEEAETSDQIFQTQIRALASVSDDNSEIEEVAVMLECLLELLR